MKVYPIGYSTPGAKKCIDELLQTKTILVDTRLIPWSWDEQWRRQELEDRYGDKYKFAGEYLGNKGKDEGLIRIADIDTGINGLMRYFDEGYDLILLCQCKIYEKCHVSHIVDRLQQLLIIEVVRFSEQLQEGMIKAISVCQPYASWLANPQKFLAENLTPKRIENRNWSTDYRGPILIHASKKFEGDAITGETPS